MKILEGIAPDSGAYLNEVSPAFGHIRNILKYILFCLGVVGLQIRVRLEEILLWRPLRSPSSHQAKIRSHLPLPRLRRYRIRRVGPRSHLSRLKQASSHLPQVSIQPSYSLALELLGYKQVLPQQRLCDPHHTLSQV